MSKSFSELYQKQLLYCIQQAVDEDLSAAGDHTSKAIFPAEHQSKAKLIAKGIGVTLVVVHRKNQCGCLLT